MKERLANIILNTLLKIFRGRQVVRVVKQDALICYSSLLFTKVEIMVRMGAGKQADRKASRPSKHEKASRK